VHTPHRRDWNFLGVGGSQRPKHLKKCTKFNWNFLRGKGDGKNAFHGQGTCMVIFWNYTIFPVCKKVSLPDKK